ncbi:MAG: hypothetical protein AAGD10_20045 [Myxococcota bacterium]
MNKTLRSARLFFCFLVACGGTDDPTEPSGGQTEGTDVEMTPSIELSPEICVDPARAQATVQALSGSASGGAGAGSLEMNIDQLQVLLSTPAEGPFYMVNLIKFREQAVYADGRQADLTGREANALYSPTEFLAAIGARVVFSTGVDQQLDGDEVLWEEVAIVEYPCPAAFLAMTMDPGFQERSIHKDAGVETTLVMFTELLPAPAPVDPDQSEAAYPPTEDDPAFDIIHVMDFHDIAHYEPDAEESERTGAEAWALYQGSGQDASLALGHYPRGNFQVRGTLIGTPTGWDEVQIMRMSSLAGFEALLDDETRKAGAYHRLAALQQNYSMITYPVLADIPYADGTSGGAQLTVTPNGTGTLCQDDGDCPSAGFMCLSAGGGGGFCTPRSCGAGTCEASYVCCRDCSTMAAATLPFSESACLPEGLIDGLRIPPASCTCD